MSNYYCLIAGLPELHLEDTKMPYQVASFKEEIYDQLDGKDKKVIDLFFLQYDNSNLLKYLKDKDAVLDPRGRLTVEDLEIIVKQGKEGDALIAEAPAYFEAFLTEYFQEKKEETTLLYDDQLATLYYAYAMKSGNAFAAKWFEFNLDLNNMLIAAAARKYDFDADRYIIGQNYVAKMLRTSSARDWGLSGDFDYVEAVQRIAEEKDLHEKEHRTDQLKWEWLDEQTFFHYFSIERILAYLLRLEMLERWQELDKEAGEANLRQMISRLKEEVTLPEDYE